jgi:hypothetical protein
MQGFCFVVNVDGDILQHSHSDWRGDCDGVASVIGGGYGNELACAKCDHGLLQVERRKKKPLKRL